MIGFAAPLFAALALAAGFVWFLHSRREYRHTVPSLVLWRRLQTHAGLKPRARLIPPITLPLILQLLAVALLTLALTQPFWGRAGVPDHLVVVLDTSAAMAASDGQGTLLDTARADLLADFTGRGGLAPERLSVIAAGPHPAYAAARWAWEDDRLAEALNAVVPTDGNTDWRETARLISSLVDPAEVTEILMVGTAPVPDIVAETLPDLAFTERILAGPGDQAGLSGHLLPTDPQNNIWTLEGEVFAGSQHETLTITLQYAADIGRTPLDWETIALEIDQAGPTAFSQELQLPGPGLLTATIDPDSTPRDNRLRFLLDPAPESLDILYVGSGDQPLLRAFNAVGGVRVFSDETVSETSDGFGLVVLEGGDPAQRPATNAVVIETAGDPLADPDPDFWITDHPLARDLDWSALDIDVAVGLTPLPGETVLLSADGAALITAAATENGRLVRIGFDPAASNWPELAGFPVFAANLIDWMGKAPGTLPPTSCTVGLACRVDARLAGQPMFNLEAPRAAVAPLPMHDFIPVEAGLFRVGRGALTSLVAVNASPAAPIAAAYEPVQNPALPLGLAPWLIGAGLAILIVEAAITAGRKGRLIPVSALRLVTLALLGAALVDLPWPWPERGTDIVIVTPTDAAAGAEIPAGGALVAGPAPRVLADPGDGIGADAGALRVTHTGRALNLAVAMIPPDRRGHVVLAGDAARDPALERRLVGTNVVIDHLELPDLAAGEIYVDRLDAPRQVLPGEAVPLTALVHSGDARSVAMEIVADGEAVASQDVDLVAGQNRIEAVLPAIETGENLIELRLTGADAHPQNDALGKLLSTAPVRPVAIISADPAHGEAFARLLADQGLETEVFEPRRAPYYLKDWLGFGDIVLINTPALALTTLQQELIETTVARYGMGLVILGGPNSFGPGGYFGTPLEALSPLSSRVPQDAPEVAMIFVLDRSGSMQQKVGEGNRLDVAKSATLAATELLNPQSRVGIIAFDAEASTLLPLTRLSDAPDAVETALGGFDPGGGTAIYPGLVEAFAMMQGVDAPAKHVVVMTDGLSQPGDFPGIVGRLRAEGVTISSVAIGQGADTGVARTIADLGGGSAHVTTDFAALPSILSQEAMLLASPVEEGATQPVWTDRGAPFLSALPVQLPPLAGFVATTAKPEARLAATTRDARDRDMPVLAWWRYGNGMVLALATDATGPWSEAWQRLPQYGALWNDILLRFQPTTPRPGLTLATQSNGDYLDLRVSALDADGLPLTGQTLVAMVSAPGAAEGQPTPLTETRPGFYEGRRLLDAVGRYDLSIDQGEGIEPIAAAYYHSYDPRYDFSRSGGAAALAAATGGRALSHDEITALGSALGVGWRHQWPIWVLAAFGLFLLDLTLRYRGFSARRKAGSGPTEPDALRQKGPIR